MQRLSSELFYIFSGCVCDCRNRVLYMDAAFERRAV
jgi:hypothetical protein